MADLASRVHSDTTTEDELDRYRSMEEGLYTAVVSDSLDQLGRRNQAMHERLRPVHASCCFAGRARTIA